MCLVSSSFNESKTKNAMHSMREKELNSDVDEVKYLHVALFCPFFRREKELEA